MLVKEFSMKSRPVKTIGCGGEFSKYSLFIFQALQWLLTIGFSISKVQLFCIGINFRCNLIFFFYLIYKCLSPKNRSFAYVEYIDAGKRLNTFHCT